MHWINKKIGRFRPVIQSNGNSWPFLSQISISSSIIQDQLHSLIKNPTKNLNLIWEPLAETETAFCLHLHIICISLYVRRTKLTHSYSPLQYPR